MTETTNNESGGPDGPPDLAGSPDSTAGSSVAADTNASPNHDVNNSATCHKLLAAIDLLRDPTHALSGLAAIAADRAQGTTHGSVAADVEREVRRVTESVLAVLAAASDHRRALGTGFVSPARTGADVLVVDDNAVNQALTAAQLSQLGYSSDMAMSGEEALDYLEARLPKLVLMDWHMVGLDGLATTRRIREIEDASSRPRVTIIGLTAQAMAGDRDRCIDAGMDSFLAKPVPLNELKAEIQRWI